MPEMNDDVDIKFGSSDSLTLAHTYFESPIQGLQLQVGNIQRTFKCRKGHIYRASEPFVVLVNQEPNYRSKPICPYCYVDWHSEQFGAVEVNDE